MVESVQTSNLLHLTGVLAAIGHELKFIGRFSNSTNAWLVIMASGANGNEASDIVLRIWHFLLFSCEEMREGPCGQIFLKPNPASNPVDFFLRTAATVESLVEHSTKMRVLKNDNVCRSTPDPDNVVEPDPPR
jgi:hypothetical protein